MLAFVAKVTGAVICNWYDILLHDRFTNPKSQNKSHKK